MSTGTWGMETVQLAAGGRTVREVGGAADGARRRVVEALLASDAASGDPLVKAALARYEAVWDRRGRELTGGIEGYGDAVIATAVHGERTSAETTALQVAQLAVSASTGNALRRELRA